MREWHPKISLMHRTDTSSTPSILIIIILVLTFPLWFGLGMGLIGAAVGIMGALVGVMAAIVVLPFKILFGWGDWGWGWHGFPHCNSLGLIALIIIAALIVRKRNR